MTININDMNIEDLLDEITQITGESRTEAFRKALEERRHRLTRQTTMTRSDASLISFLQEEIWPKIPPADLGVRLTKEEEEQILG